MAIHSSALVRQQYSFCRGCLVFGVCVSQVKTCQTHIQRTTEYESGILPNIRYVQLSQLFDGNSLFSTVEQNSRLGISVPIVVFLCATKFFGCVCHELSFKYAKIRLVSLFLVISINTMGSKFTNFTILGERNNIQWIWLRPKWQVNRIANLLFI